MTHSKLQSCNVPECSYTIAKSGLRDSKMSPRGLYPPSDRSTYSLPPSLRAPLTQFVNIINTSSCFFLYLSSTTGELQWDRTCLFVCMARHNEHAASVERFHRARFAAVGSCCCRALRANLNRCDGSPTYLEWRL